MWMNKGAGSLRPAMRAGMDFPSRQHFEEQIKKELPAKLKKVEFRVDMAPLDPRPDPKDQRGNPLYVYDPSTKVVSTDPLEEFLDLLPTRLVQFRVYALDHTYDAALSRATTTVLPHSPNTWIGINSASVRILTGLFHFPLNSTGKIAKKVLRQELEASV